MRVLMAVTCLCLVAATVSGAQRSSDTLAQFEDHRIRPLIMPGDVRPYTIILGFDDAQHELAELRYDSYIEKLKGVVASSSEREKEIRERLDGILKGRYRAESGELATLRVNLERSKADNWSRADAELDSFLEDIVTLGSGMDSNMLDRARFEIYRRVYLRPARVEGRDSRYDGSGLDFFELVQEATAEELQGVSPEGMTMHLDAWRVTMTPVIRVHAEAERQSSLADREAELTNDTSARVEVMIARSKRWGARQAIDYDTFVAIYRLCPSPEAGGAWTARYRSANYPWLWKWNDDVEQMATWILNNGSADQQAVVNEVLPEYLERRGELRLEAQGILYAGRGIGANLCDDVAAAYEPAGEPLKQLMQNSGQRSMLMRQARARMEQPLTEGQRAAIARLLLGR